MRKVTTINLNNSAFQIDEEGYEALRAYLERAERALADNPDRAEILEDIELAIADKCRLTLGAYKNVVSTAEIERILQEMGPVVGTAGDAAPAGAGSGTGTAGGASAGAAGGTQESQRAKPRRLYRLRDGEKWTGVCSGLAAYAGVDPTWVRVGFVLLTIFTSGFGLLAYVALVFILPVASTPEEVAAAHGQPFNAQELVDRVKKKSDELRDGHRHGRLRARLNARSSWWSPQPAAQAPPGQAARVAGGLLLPVFTVLSATWFAGMAVAAAAVWWGYHGGASGTWALDGWTARTDVPLWVAMAAVFAVYALLALPIGVARRAALYYANGGRLHGWADAWSGLLWIALVLVILAVAWHVLPGLQGILDHVRGGTQVLRL